MFWGVKNVEGDYVTNPVCCYLLLYAKNEEDEREEREKEKEENRESQEIIEVERRRMKKRKEYKLIGEGG